MFNRLIPQDNSVGLNNDKDMLMMIEKHITNVLPYRAIQDNWVVNGREDFLRILVDSLDDNDTDIPDQERLKGLGTVKLRIAVRLCLTFDISSGSILEIFNDRSLLRRSRSDSCKVLI